MGPTIVEILLRSERFLERQLAACALIFPQEVARFSIRPEIDIAAKQFFSRFDRHLTEVITSDELRAFHFASRCAGGDLWTFLDTVEDVYAYDVLKTITDQLTAMRAVRKTVHWIETNGIFREGVYD
mgnify:CR=1 FL=1